MTTKIYMTIALLVMIGLVVLTLLHSNRSFTSKLNLEDLLLGEDGKISKAAAVMMGSFLMTTWLMIYLTLNGKMTEGYFTIYCGAWIIPTVTKLIKGPSPPEPSVS